MLLHDLQQCDLTTWTPRQLEEAGDWAMRAHLRASDNVTVRVPVKPAFMPEYRPFEIASVRPMRPILSGSADYETR